MIFNTGCTLRLSNMVFKEVQDLILLCSHIYDVPIAERFLTFAIKLLLAGQRRELENALLLVLFCLIFNDPQIFVYLIL